MLLGLFTQSALAVESDLPSDSLDISSVSAQVVWSKKREHTLFAYYDQQSQLYWALPSGLDPTRLPLNQNTKEFRLMVMKALPSKSYVDARAFVADLIVDGQGGWDLPSFNEIIKSNPSYSLKADGIPKLMETSLIATLPTVVQLTIMECKSASQELMTLDSLYQCADAQATMTS